MNTIDGLAALGKKAEPIRPLTAKELKEKEAEEADRRFVLECQTNELQGIAKRQVNKQIHGRIV